MVKFDAKFAEKLSILSHHSVGILTRLYNLKQTFENPETRPSFLSDKVIEPVLKNMVKKFPLIDNTKTMSTPIPARRVEIAKVLEPHYYTLLDALEFKDVAADLLTSLGSTVSACNLAANFHLTRGFLDLLVNYASAMIILSRVEDRKVIAALYCTTHELSASSAEPNYGRLSQWLSDYELPIRRLSDDFQGISRFIASAIMSCRSHYGRFHIQAALLRQSNIFHMLTSRTDLLVPTHTTEVLSDVFVSLDRMTSWIVIGFLLCPAELDHSETSDLLRVALIDGFITPLFRDEVLHIHAEYETTAAFYKTTGRLTKLKQLVSDCAAFAVQSSGGFHRERRHFFRQSIQDLQLLFTDKPGLLGPKLPSLLIVMGLARDEVIWYFRHCEAAPPKTRGKYKDTEYRDNTISELIFWLKEAAALVKSSETILRQYYGEFLAGYDLELLRDAVSNIPCPEEESTLITSFVDLLSGLSPATLASNPPSFAGLRLDWFRLQALMSVNKAPVQLASYPELTLYMNLISFHSYGVDAVDELVRQTSSLTGLVAYRRELIKHFEPCMNTPRQSRYSFVFPAICGEFPLAAHEFLAEERALLGQVSVSLADKFLEHIASNTARTVHQYCMEHVRMGHELLPVTGTQTLIAAFNEKVAAAKEAGRKPTRKAVAPPQLLARNPTVIAHLSELHFSLADLCWSISHDRTLRVFDTDFCPREYLVEALQKLFSGAVVGLMGFRDEEHRINRPSILLQATLAYMEGLFSLENYVDINMLELFYNVLQEQTQLKDRNGKPTVATGYSTWYMDFLTRQVDTGHYAYSALRKSFVSRQDVPFKAEQFTDLPELMSLCQLIGPYGVRSLDEMIMKILTAEVGQIKGYVMNNQDGLQILQKSWHDAARCADVLKKLKNVDELIVRSLRIGALLSFRSLLTEALSLVLATRAPLIASCVKDMHEFFPDVRDPLVSVDRIALLAGMTIDIDPVISDALKEHCMNPDYDFKVWNLLLVFFAASLCTLSTRETSIYKPALEANANNAHCLPLVIHNLSSTLLSLTAEADQHIPECQKEFLTIASVLLMRQRADANSTSKDAPKELDSIVIILDKFVQMSPFLNAEELEECLPYTLLQASYSVLHQRRAPTGSKNVGF
ncbi:hypothetical protein CAOG_000229 [Capsaspora owczarzaki ATCC 30864]|uniref:Nck-associated protein 1 n=1 Tax=Capsaspora owczarzaki (strain ATCC 30864) TaxID=595528 RepID=A0A0D2WI72_CAPO3|nr:hypothetical protein CAOG_000229 [Capsaspora owczarzaki ATCC 30864]